MKVAVVGGGVMGAATAWRIAKRGVEVVVFDRHSPPHPYGSSHGESRIIRSAYFEGSWYVPLLRETFALWRELEGISGKRILTMTGALMIGDGSSEVVAGAEASAREHGLEAEVLDSEALRGRFPGHLARDGDVAVLDRQAGVLDPEAAVSAMLGLAPRVVRDTEVRSISELRSQFDAVVVAAGPWTPELVGWIPLRVERQVHGWFSIARDADWFGPDRFPAFVRETRERGFMYGIPSLDGRTIKVGRHHEGEFTTPQAIRRRVDERDLDPLRLLTATYLRGVSGHVTRTLTCMYTNTPDNHFVIDFSPDDRRVVVISACSGHGFKFGPIIGDIAADLVVDGGTRRDISQFSASRFAATPQVPDHQRDGHQ
ncbi:MAG TPA: N-methyl-L-tryptophan oxidase [Candidatus Dormibacteraeota bacterium]|nr:N-methyl-L-tryptophan oxidase [Candidatus Dormibacteraeota bacterium]